MMTSTVTDPRVQEDADEYDVFAVRLRREFRQILPNQPLFTTDSEGLFDLFLRYLPADKRQHYTCRCCRAFVERFGGLVFIDEKGATHSALWEMDAPIVFRKAVLELRQYVHAARVTGVFVNSDPVLGTTSNVSKKTGVRWEHMHVVPYAEGLYRGALLNASQAAAEKVQDYATLCRALDDFPIEIVKQAHTLLTNDSLFRSEKCVGVAKWLLDLHEARQDRRTRHNQTWRAVASAPPGYAHVRTSMIGTLLEDIQAGKPFADIKRSFDSKMNPLQYQRPTAAPSDGQLAAAEKVVAALGVAGSLARRYATLEDVRPHAIWVPRKVEDRPTESSVFGHLKKAPVIATDSSAPVMSWEKFARTVLLNAEKIELLVPHSNAPFFGFVTATNPDAPPILQWDAARDAGGRSARNPVSWYLYAHGAHATSFNLSAGQYVEVEAITPQPSEWHVSMLHQGSGAYLVLRGAYDMQARKEGGVMLFPEILRAEYHGIRSAIEAYSKSKTLDGDPVMGACGICIHKSSTNWNQTLRVTVGSSRVSYRIDRWD